MWADALHCGLDYVSGSNALLDKLIDGQWDTGFLVVEPGQRIHDFFS